MKKFLYRFLIVVLAFGLLTPTWLTKLWAPTAAHAAAPTVTVNKLATNNQSPKLTGTVDDNGSTMEIYVGTTGYSGAVISGASSPYTWTLPAGIITPDLAEGIYNITASATNGDGSSIDPTEKELTIDLTKPASTVGDAYQGQTFGPNNWPGKITGTSNDLGDVQSGIDKVLVKVLDPSDGILLDSVPATVDESGNWSMNLSVDSIILEGLYKIQSIAKDNAGNSEDDGTGSFIWDSTSPAGPDATPAGGNYVGPQTITLSDTAPDLDAIYYTLDGTELSKTSTKYSAPFIISADATLKAVAYDKAGNPSVVLNASYGIAPVIHGESAVNVTTNSATISWTTDTPSTSRVIYDIVSHPALGSAPNYDYAFSSVEDPALVLNHSVTISGLTSGMTYFYRTISHGSPEAVGLEFSFKTTVKVVQAVAVIEEPVAPQPIEPSTPQVLPPTTPIEQGQIKSAETPVTSESEKINWTPWIILFILIILAGAATGGYFYWFGRDEEEELISREVIEKNRKSSVKKLEKTSAKSKRW